MEELTFFKSLLRILESSKFIVGLGIAIVFWVVRLAIKGVALQFEKSINDKASKEELEELKEDTRKDIRKMEDKQHQFEILITKSLK